jgi:cell division protein FtsB
VGLNPRAVRRLLACAVAALAGYYAVWGGEYSAFHLMRLGEESAAAQSRLAHVREEVDSLKALAERLESDDETVERIARERFGMVREGELLYRFVPVDPDRPGEGGRGVDIP